MRKPVLGYKQSIITSIQLEHRNLGNVAHFTAPVHRKPWAGLGLFIQRIQGSMRDPQRHEWAGSWEFTGTWDWDAPEKSRNSFSLLLVCSPAHRCPQPQMKQGFAVLILHCLWIAPVSWPTLPSPMQIYAGLHPQGQFLVLKWIFYPRYRVFLPMTLEIQSS